MKRVFVFAGYQHFAACHLIYHVGRVLEEQFGYEPVVVRLAEETPDDSPFAYPREYPTIELAGLAESVRPQDLFLPLASASDLCFGLKLACRKLLYVQGANTFRVLDGFMDGYVSVSSFVQRTLQHFYAIESPVIHPFIDLDHLPTPVAWRDRDPNAVVIFTKAPPPVEALIDGFCGRLSARHPGVRPNFHVVQRGIPHAVLMARLARTRYVVALSPTEGFGLVPLEAMASGCAVTGFHGGGGLDYMNNENSRCVGYPRLDSLVDQFVELFTNEALAGSLAAQGMADARRFTQSRFDADWVGYLKAFRA